MSPEDEKRLAEIRARWFPDTGTDAAWLLAKLDEFTAASLAESDLSVEYRNKLDESERARKEVEERLMFADDTRTAYVVQLEAMLAEERAKREAAEALVVRYADSARGHVDEVTSIAIEKLNMRDRALAAETRVAELEAERSLWLSKG